MLTAHGTKDVLLDSGCIYFLAEGFLRQLLSLRCSDGVLVFVHACLLAELVLFVADVLDPTRKEISIQAKSNISRHQRKELKLKEVGEKLKERIK